MSKVVFIAGMHRSGTSMVARLLNRCGVYLGPEHVLSALQPDNLEGYWENEKFVLFNDEVLSALGGGWDCPPNVEAGWEKSDRVSDFLPRAFELIEQFSTDGAWGWKDPRNSLTFPFWNELIPSMKVVICVRNPLDVAHSLLRRNNSSPALAYHLWMEHNQRIMLSTKPENRIITHYDTYFRDPRSELTRILNFLELEVSESNLIEALDTVRAEFNHHQATLLDLMSKAPLKVIDFYQMICNETMDSLKLSADQAAETKRFFSENLQGEDHAQKYVRLLSEEAKRLMEVIREKESDTQMLKSLLSAKERELSDIHRSKAWQLVQFARRTRQKILG